MKLDIVLDAAEMAALNIQDPTTRSDGGFQSLIVSLQERCDWKTGEIELTDDDRERIKRYAFDYKHGGWETRLVAIFGRHLGPLLDRQA